MSVVGKVHLALQIQSFSKVLPWKFILQQLALGKLQVKIITHLPQSVKLKSFSDTVAYNRAPC